ncbi:MAG: uroporphyrinogen decarboxylase family protein [Planctomycetota bacterium]
MKPREVILRTIEHREVRPVPYTLGFEGDVAERLDEYYGGKGWRKRIETYFAGTGVVETMNKEPMEQEGLQRDPYGSIWRVDRRPFHLEQPALPEPSFDNYDWPAPERFFVNEKRAAEAREQCLKNKDNYFVRAGLGWGLFETCWGIRGFQNVLMDVVAEPDFFEELLDRITDQFLAYVDFTCRSLPEIDAIMFGDDWGEQRGVIVGPERWRKFFKPRWAKIYSRVHEHGKLTISHCCGSIVDIMGDIIEIGLDVLESVQPEARGMNPYELKKRHGDKLTFWGCLGSQSTIPFGTPDEIRAEVNKLCREMGKGGGYILAPAKALQPETPTENAAAVVEAFTNQPQI